MNFGDPLSPSYASTVARLVGMGSVLAAAEMLSLRRNLADDGLFGWAVTRTNFRKAIRNGSIVVLDVLYQYNSRLVQYVVQILCGAALLLNVFPGYEFYVLLPMFLIQAATMLIPNTGNDGADQMQVILIAGLLCYYWTPDVQIQRAGLWFIAIQVVVGYTAGGLAKLPCKAWRTGTVLKQSLALGIGSETVYRHLPKSQRINQLLAWSVILFECCFPLVLLVYPPLCVLILIGGIAFHLFNAYAFGLPRFLFTYCASYPAILLLNSDIHAKAAFGS